jgi:hypothetical protein
MTEATDRGSDPRRATWVALRTLHERPRLVGRTTGGEPIYDVRAVRLVLNPGGSAFRRLIQCSRCGKDMSGPAVSTPADLDRPAASQICRDCITAAESPWEPWQPPVGIEGDVEELIVAGPPAVVDAEGDGAAVEAVRRRLGELEDAQRLEAAERHQADDRTRTVLMKAVGEHLAAVQGQMSTSTAALADRIATLDGRLLQAAPSAPPPGESAEETRAAVQEVARRQGECDERVADVVAQLAVRPSVDDVAQAVRAQVEEARAGIADSVEASLAEQLGRLRADVGAVERQLDDQIAALTESVAAHRRELDAQLGSALAQEVSTITRMIDELAEAGRRRESRLDAVERKAAEEEVRVTALGAAADSAAGRLRTLEAKVQAHVKRLTQLLGARSGDRRPPLRASSPPRPLADVATDGTVLDFLEGQLREAELRLSRHALDRGDGA